MTCDKDNSQKSHFQLQILFFHMTTFRPNILARGDMETRRRCWSTFPRLRNFSSGEIRPDTHTSGQYLTRCSRVRAMGGKWKRSESGRRFVILMKYCNPNLAIMKEHSGANMMREDWRLWVLVGRGQGSLLPGRGGAVLSAAFPINNVVIWTLCFSREEWRNSPSGWKYN